jgi:hypothetical protein
LTWYNDAWGSICDDVTDVNNAGHADNGYGYVNRGGGRKA